MQELDGSFSQKEDEMLTEELPFVEHPGKEYDRLRYIKALNRIIIHAEASDAVKKIAEDALRDTEPDEENKP